MKTVGIYLLKQNDKVVYVGQSINVDLRINTHKNEKLKEFDNVHIIKCSQINLNSVEAFYIHYYAPLYNKRLYELRVGVPPPRASNTVCIDKDTYISSFSDTDNINIDHKILAKHFDNTIQAMWKLKNNYKNNKTGLWIIYVKAYNWDLFASNLNPTPNKENEPE